MTGLFSLQGIGEGKGEDGAICGFQGLQQTLGMLCQQKWARGVMDEDGVIYGLTLEGSHPGLDRGGPGLRTLDKLNALEVTKSSLGVWQHIGGNHHDNPAGPGRQQGLYRPARHGASTQVTPGFGPPCTGPNTASCGDHYGRKAHGLCLGVNAMLSRLYGAAQSA
jgi:hypothetical protein